MSKVCVITGRHPHVGNIINRKGQSKKSGGIGMHVTSITKRKFRPNLQRVRIKMPNGGTKRVWVSVKALKAGLVQKARLSLALAPELLRRRHRVDVARPEAERDGVGRRGDPAHVEAPRRDIVQAVEVRGPKERIRERPLGLEGGLG